MNEETKYFECWKVAVDQVNQVGKRRSEINVFFISIMSLLFTGEFIGLSSFSKNVHVVYLVEIMSMFGICICGVWMLEIVAFRNKTDVKYKIIRELEQKFDADIFRKEYVMYYLECGCQDEDAKGSIFKEFAVREMLIPVCFVLLFAGMIYGSTKGFILQDYGTFQ